MRELDPKIDLQLLLGNQILNVLQGGVIEGIRKNCEGNSADVGFRSMREGNSLKVQETLLPQFYALCEEVKTKLGFENPIDFYITGNSEVNACAFYSDDEERPHIVEINSGLFNLMNEEEIKYVVGHEIGHLINCDSIISGIFHFIYPDEDALKRCPGFLLGRYKLYNQLAELSADRYGYMANENFDACVTAIYKMASGLYLEKMDVSIKTLMEENNRRLEYFLKEGGVSEGTHPVNPIRIRALELFAKEKTQSGLNRGMDELVNILQDFLYSELDYALADFVAAASIIMTQIDGKRDKNEEEVILAEMADFCLFPHKVLKQTEKGDVMKIFNESIAKVMELAPYKNIDLLTYYINVAFADGIIDEKEIELIYDLGKKVGLPEGAIAIELGKKVQKDFRPLASALK